MEVDEFMSQIPEQKQMQQPRGETQQQQRGGGQQQMQTSHPESRQFPTRSYLSQNVRTNSIQRLNRCLADSLILRTQTKYAHWNVKGLQFYSLHELFDDIAEELEDHVDSIAERVTSLGGKANGSAHQSVAQTGIPALTQNAVSGVEFIEVLADHLAMHNANLATDIQAATQAGDVDTADLLNEISREIGKQLWFLEAHLQSHQAQPPATNQQTQMNTQGGYSTQR